MNPFEKSRFRASLALELFDTARRAAHAGEGSEDAILSASKAAVEALRDLQDRTVEEAYRLIRQPGSNVVPLRRVR